MCTISREESYKTDLIHHNVLDMTPYSVVEICQYCRGTNCVHFVVMEYYVSSGFRRNFGGISGFRRK